MRQCLPAGKGGDRSGGQERAQRRGQVLGLARGRGHREHEPARAARGPLASAADSSGRSAVGATRSRSPPPGVPGWLSSAVRRWGSSATAASSPARLMLSQCRWWLGATGTPQDIRLPRGQGPDDRKPGCDPKSKPRRSASTSSLRPAGGAGSPERLIRGPEGKTKSARSRK